MNDELSEKELDQLFHYKAGIVRLFKTYCGKVGGDDGNLISEKTLFPGDGIVLEKYNRAACKHTQNRIVRNSGNFIYPEITSENEFLFKKISSLAHMPYDFLPLNALTNSYQNLKVRGQHMIQELACDVTAEAIWFLFDVKESRKIRCLGLPKEALPDCVGYVNEDEILELDHFEIHDWHRIPDVIADSITNGLNAHKYMFDILADSQLNIS